MMKPTTYDVLMAKAHRLCLRQGGTFEDYLQFNAHILTSDDLKEFDDAMGMDNIPTLTYAECADIMYSAHCED